MLHALELIHSRLTALEVSMTPSQTPSLEVPGYRRRYAPKDSSQKTYTPAQVAKAVSKFNSYWKIVTEGRDINFQFGADNLNHVTSIEPALLRNEALSKLLNYRPTIIEPFAGSGADTISFLWNMHPQTIYCTELSTENTISFLKSNVERFQEVNKQDTETHVVIMNSDASTFFTDVSEDENADGDFLGLHADLLYLDPPWTLPGEKTEAVPARLVAYLQKEVFVPMYRRGFSPKLIVLKTRFPWEEMHKLMDKFPGYTHASSMAFTPQHNKIYFHVLLNTSHYTVEEWQPSHEYWEIYKDVMKPSPGDRGSFKEPPSGDKGGFKYQRSYKQ